MDHGTNIIWPQIRPPMKDDLHQDQTCTSTTYSTAQHNAYASLVFSAYRKAENWWSWDCVNKVKPHKVFFSLLFFSLFTVGGASVRRIFSSHASPYHSLVLEIKRPLSSLTIDYGSPSLGLRNGRPDIEPISSIIYQGRCQNWNLLHESIWKFQNSPESWHVFPSCERASHGPWEHVKQRASDGGVDCGW